MSDEKPKSTRITKKAEPQVVETTEPVVALNEVAVGIFRDKNNKFYTVVIKYDFESGNAVISDKIPQETRADANERFRIIAATEVFK